MPSPVRPAFLASLLPRVGRHQLLFLEPDDGGNPAGGQGGQDPAPSDPAAGLRNALQRHQGDALALANQLYSENYQLRERNRQVAAQVPAQGSVVLTSEQAAQWAAYQQLGAPDALKTTLEGAQTAAQELTGLKRQATIRTAADAAGFKSTVLGQLAGDLAIEVREIETNGKKAPAAFVKGQDGQEVGLAQYAQQHWADFLPALQAATPQPQGTQWPPQTGGQGGGADLIAQAAQRFQQQRDTGFNPFKPATPKQQP